MAYVAISKDVTQRMKVKIHRMRDHEIKTECPSLETAHTIDASDMFNLGCWGAEHVHLVNVIPKDWMATETSSYIRIRGQHQPDPETTIDVSANVQFQGMTRAYRRPSPGYYNKGDSELSVDQLRELPSTTPGRDEAMQHYIEACNQAVIRARWDKVEKQMMTFLDRCKSINEAIKLFPGIKLYLAQSDIERVERKVVRAPREALVEDLDLDAMTAAAVVANINGGV